MVGCLGWYGFKLALISKGLRHPEARKLLLGVPFQACPDFKGIKTQIKDAPRRGQSFKLALISKGLRRAGDCDYDMGFGFKLALISKGLRRGVRNFAGVRQQFQACPDFKGIKTLGDRGLVQIDDSFKLALISKGLRPMDRMALLISAGFKLALISKGLRHRPSSNISLTRSFKLALISKGLRRRRIWRFETVPGFKLALISKGLRLESWLVALVGMVSSLP